MYFYKLKWPLKHSGVYFNVVSRGVAWTNRDRCFKAFSFNTWADTLDVSFCCNPCAMDRDLYSPYFSLQAIDPFDELSTWMCIKVFYKDFSAKTKLSRCFDPEREARSRGGKTPWGDYELRVHINPNREPFDSFACFDIKSCVRDFQFIESESAAVFSVPASFSFTDIAAFFGSVSDVIPLYPVSV